MFKVYSRYSIWIAVILIAYFLLLKLFGLHQYPVLSAVNGLIYGMGIYMAIKNYNAKKTNFKYEKSFEVGFLTGGIATILFTAFMAVYMYQIDSEFATHILEILGRTVREGNFDFSGINRANGFCHIIGFDSFLYATSQDILEHRGWKKKHAVN